MMSDAVLHYVYDPLCGWCYGAAPLLKAASAVAGLRIEIHGGGLWVGARRQPMGPALRDYVRPHDQRIEAMTGQHFGERYFNQLLLDERRALDSEPPIRAILAVHALGGDDLQMLQRIQESHYRDGLWVGDSALLAALAEEQGIAAEAFTAACRDADVDGHLQESAQWLRRLAGNGYPTLGLVKDGQVTSLPVARLLGHPERCHTWLAQQLAG